MFSYTFETGFDHKGLSSGVQNVSNKLLHCNQFYFTGSLKVKKRGWFFLKQFKNDVLYVVQCSFFLCCHCCGHNVYIFWMSWFPVMRQQYKGCPEREDRYHTCATCCLGLFFSPSSLQSGPGYKYFSLVHTHEAVSGWHTHAQQCKSEEDD
jgi:hypothetical protein